MAEFHTEVFQNEFLSEGSTDVHAIVTVTSTGAGTAGAASATGTVAEIVMVDTSGSMQGPNMDAAKYAAQVAVDQIADGTWFAIIGGSHVAQRAFPYPNAPVAIVQMEPGARKEAKRAIGLMRPSGGTAISTWLRLADQVFSHVPQATQRHAILLTDGRNESEPRAELSKAISDVTGRYQCDARGVGAIWEVAELREIATALLGTVDLIRNPADIAEDFRQLVAASMSKGVADAELRVWAPQGAQVLFVRQVSPTVEDLSARRTTINPLTGSYPTGAWADESRDYHVAIRLSAKAIGQEQLAARVQIVLGDDVAAQGLVKATWSNNSELTARIDQQVAHYTGQTELAQMIQEGLAAKASGDDATATTKLGRAVQLAAETGNDEATSKLRKVVDIEDEKEGTVRLRSAVNKADEMALDTASTKTTRIKK